MPSENTLHLLESASGDAIKHPYIVYTIISLLVLDVILIAYLSYKLFRLYRRKVKSNFEKKNRRYRALVFILVFLSLLLRAIFEGDQILCTIFYDATTHLDPLVLIIDALPSLLFVNIACVFCYFWYELYSSFDDHNEPVERRVNRYKTVLITVNLTIYFAFLVCSIFHLNRDEKIFAIAMRAMCALSLIFSIAMLKIHGNRLYSRALMLIAYTGRTAKSSGFRTLYIILMICCTLKLIKELIILYFSITVGEDLLQDLDNIQEGYNLSIFIIYVIVFYIFGEYGLFLSLIMMMDSYANKSRVSFTEDETHKNGQDDYLLDNDQYTHTATSSRIIPVQHFEDGEVSVSFA